MSYRPKGETTHYILRVASVPSPTAVTDSLDFRVAGAPLQIQFASAKCVRCAPLRSGGRRLAVRKMIECHISAQPRTPFCHYVAFPLKGKRGTWREKQASHILHVPFRCFPLWWRKPPKGGKPPEVADYRNAFQVI